MSLQFEHLEIATPNRDEEETTPKDSVIPDLEELELPELPETDLAAPVSPGEAPGSFMGQAAVPPTELEARRNRIQEAIGEAVGVSSAQAEHLAAVMRDGVTCAVHITRERLLVKNNAEELGIASSLANEVFGGLGTKLLAPKDLLGQMNSADTMARTLLAKYGLKTPWGRFIPTRNWQAFKTAFERQRTAYFNAVNRLVAMIEDGRHGTWLRQVYSGLATDRWKHAKETWVCSMGFTYADRMYPPDEYVELVVESARARVPSPEVILAAARFEYNLSVVQAPDTQLAIVCATENQDLNRELVLHMNERKRTLIDDFLQAARAGLAEHINELVKSVNKTLTNTATVHGKTINRILRAISDMRTLNVTSDQEFEDRITELESFITERRESPNKVSSREVLEQLRATANRITGSLNRESEEVSQFANVGE